MLLPMVDVIFSDVAQPDQARIVGLNAHHFLKHGGHAVIAIKASCIDSTLPADVVFAAEVKNLRAEMFKPMEQLTLEPYERVRVHFYVCRSLFADLFHIGPRNGYCRIPATHINPSTQNRHFVVILRGPRYICIYNVAFSASRLLASLVHLSVL